MIFTIHSMIFKETPIGDYFKKGVEIWKDILAEHASDTIEDLSKAIHNSQISKFELNCGGRDVGQEILAWSIFGYLYDIGCGYEKNKDLAQKIYNSIKRSCCSMEVKHYAEDAAKHFGLFDE